MTSSSSTDSWFKWSIGYAMTCECRSYLYVLNISLFRPNICRGRSTVWSASISRTVRIVWKSVPTVCKVQTVSSSSTPNPTTNVIPAMPTALKGEYCQDSSKVWVQCSLLNNPLLSVRNLFSIRAVNETKQRWCSALLPSVKQYKWHVHETSASHDNCTTTIIKEFRPDTSWNDLVTNTETYISGSSQVFSFEKFSLIHTCVIKTGYFVMIDSCSECNCGRGGIYHCLGIVHKKKGLTLFPSPWLYVSNRRN